MKCKPATEEHEHGRLRLAEFEHRRSGHIPAEKP